ncbi:MAG: hypothetical protein KA124_11095, partial [Luteimonas sp.]|nr:hypothetical protein [Luteimonas sp.]
MTESDQTPSTAAVPEPEPAHAAAAPPAAHGSSHRLLYALLAVFVASLAFGAWGVWRALSDAGGDPQSQLAA